MPYPTGDYDFPRDPYAHGTHTSSTAAESPVRDADSFGYAKGAAIGIVPMAWLAITSAFYTSNGVLTSAINSPSLYHAVVVFPLGMKVNVVPSVLNFTGFYSKAER
ncbi:hypothetical protein RJ641_019303 [Dillenia turbinata]|uniref:Uncharacterized protein n=1 Tax=Dillenia turbinata TaxID=194707 RepID=A0AAN8YXF1_9MAGN